MNKDYIIRRIEEADKRIKELLEHGDIKKISEEERHRLVIFFRQRSLHRLQTARIIYEASGKDNYEDYGEAVGAGYYSMYYIVHGYVAANYHIKLKEGTPGVHAITLHFILYYLVKTNKLARNLYEEYCKALEMTAETHAFNLEEYREAAFEYAAQYDDQKSQREKFTYFTTTTAVKEEAKRAIEVAEQFINKMLELIES